MTENYTLHTFKMDCKLLSQTQKNLETKLAYLKQIKN